MRQATEAEHVAINEWFDANDPNGDAFDCMDNCRIATVGNAAEEAAFDEAERGGCCGCMSITLKTADGVEFLYGFNYGH
jgi:hypothetical protein